MLFVVSCSLIGVRCLLVAVCCLCLCVCYWLLFGGWWSFVVRRLLLDVCCFVRAGSWFVVVCFVLSDCYCVLRVGCCVLCVVCCLLFVVCCLLLVLFVVRRCFPWACIVVVRSVLLAVRCASFVV